MGQKVLVISDTHGLLRPGVLELAEQADAILHAGDVGRPEVLEALIRIPAIPLPFGTPPKDNSILESVLFPAPVSRVSQLFHNCSTGIHLKGAAPGKVHAIRGNVDRTAPLKALPGTLLLELGGVWLYLMHDLTELDLVPEVAGVRVVISGHTHQPKLEERGGVLYLNPGSVGPRRFRLPVACAWLHIGDGRITAEPVTLEV